MNKSKSSITSKTLRLYWQFAWKYPKYVLALMFFIPTTIFVFRFLPPLFVAQILDKIGSGDFVSGDLFASFGPELVAYIGLTLLGGIVMWRVNIYLVWQLEMRVLQDIYNKIFAHLVEQSADFHANKFGGSLVSQTNKFAGSYVRIADTVYFQITGLIVSFIATIAILAGRAPYVVLFLLGFSIVFLFTAIKITKYVRVLNAKEAAAQTRQTGFLADAVTNVMALKSFANKSLEHKRFYKATQFTRSTTNELMWASLKRDVGFASFTTSVGVIALVISLVSVVYYSADVATVFLVVNYTGVITQNLWEFSQNTLRNLNRGLGDAREMTEILHVKPSVQDPKNPENVQMHRGGIEFDSVHFDHADSTNSDPLFKDLSLRIKPGEKVGLVGHSGSGKTTLTKILLRFADIDSGVIRIDGQDLSKVAQEDLRSKISYVPQEPLLFHRSIKENIAYGKPTATDKEIIAVAKLAHAHEFIGDLPKEYETLVGERGVKLSGGQRQRVAIARAMIKNAPVLVLDEATSALDSESEALIQDALWRLMEGRTAIVIAHRLSTIQKMDRILVMENGKIVEEGTHKELIRLNGTYSELWTHQSGGFLED